MEQWKLAHTLREREIGRTVLERNQAFLVAPKINISSSTISISRHIPERFLHVDIEMCTSNVLSSTCDNIKSGKQFKMSTSKF